MNLRHTGLLLSPKEPEHWELGATDPDINPKGDWTDYRPADEPQSTALFDSEGCTLFGTGHAIITLATFKGFDDFPKDVSERFLGVLANTGPNGTDPHVVAEVIRTDGLVPASALPWTDDLENMFEYYAPKPMDSSLLSLAKALLDKFACFHKWVFPWGSSYSPAQKQDLLKAALKKGTVAVSLSGNYRFKGGKLWKNDADPDTHFAQLLRFDGDNAVIFDQYAPFIKKLSSGYNHQAAKVYFLERRTVANPTFWDQVWDVLAGYWRFIGLWKSSS